MGVEVGADERDGLAGDGVGATVLLGLSGDRVKVARGHLG